MTAPIEIVREHRREIITDLADCAEKLLLNPDSGKTGQMDEVGAALMNGLRAYEDLVQAMHTSSSATYAIKDLSAEESAIYKRAVHAVQLLRTVFGPQAG